MKKIYELFICFCLLILISCSNDPPKATHTVTFFLNYPNAPEFNAVEILDGELLVEPEKPERASNEVYDYEFMYWSLEELGNSKYDFNAPVTSDLTLYAIWNEYEKMFPWQSDEQYSIDSNQLLFNLSFNTYSQGRYQTWNLQPKEDTPVFRVYYMIAPEASYTSNLARSFTSQYSDSFPSIFDDDPAYTSSYTTSEGESISVSLYEMSVGHFDNDKFIKDTSVANFFKGMDFVSNYIDSSEYQHGYEFSFTPASHGVSNGYYIDMNLNGTVYTLARMNGQPFSNNLSDYYNGHGTSVEFRADQGDGLKSDARLKIYVTASFAFEDFTTRSTLVVPSASADCPYNEALIQ